MLVAALALLRVRVNQIPIGGPAKMSCCQQAPPRMILPLQAGLTTALARLAHCELCPALSSVLSNAGSSRVASSPQANRPACLFVSPFVPWCR